MKRLIIITLLLCFIASGINSVPIYSTKNPFNEDIRGHVKGDLGEILSEYHIYRDLQQSERQNGGLSKWYRVQPKLGNADQGIDHLFIQFDKKNRLSGLLVGETKFTSNINSDFDLLRRKQFSVEWISYRLKKKAEEYKQIIEKDAKGKLINKKPKDNNIEKYPVSSNSFYYQENGKWYMFSSEAKEVRLHNANSVIDYLQGCSDGKNKIKGMLIVYSIDEHNNLFQKTISVTWDDKGNPIKNPNGKTVIKKLSDKVLQSDASIRGGIVSALGFPDNSVHKFLSVDDLYTIISGRNIPVETFYVLLKSDINCIALNRLLNLPDNFPINKVSFTGKDVEKIIKVNIKTADPISPTVETSNSGEKVQLKKVDISDLSEKTQNDINLVKHDYYRNNIVRGVKTSATLAGGLELLREVIEGEEIDVIKISMRSLAGATIGASTQIGYFLTDRFFANTPLDKVFSNRAINEAQNSFYQLYSKTIRGKFKQIKKSTVNSSFNLKYRFLNSVIKQSDDALEDSGKVLLRGVLSDSNLMKQGGRLLGRQFTAGVASELIPGLLGSVISLGLDELYLRHNDKYDDMPIELRQAIRLRNLKVEAYSFGTSLAISGISSIGIPHVSPVVFTITDLVSNFVYEIVIPVPDELDPQILLQEYHDDKQVVDKWALDSLKYIQNAQ